MRRFGDTRPLSFSAADVQRLLDENRELRRRVSELEAQVHGDGRRPPPPSFVKPNVKKDPEDRKRSGAKEGHEAHHRPSPTDDQDTVQITEKLRACGCGEEFGDPFDYADRWVDRIIPGHVQRRHYRLAHYRCKKCGKLTAAKVPSRVAPRKSRFCWGTHFLVAAWHALGLPHSRIQVLLEVLEGNYGQKLSTGEIDKIQARANRLFAPAVDAIRKEVRAGKEVVVDNTSWRVDGVTRFLWDFIAPGIKAALFAVDRSGGHGVPERELPGNPKQTVVCDGGTCFNPLRSLKRIQRDWVHILHHAKEGLKGYETVSDAPDWRWLRSMKVVADRVLRVAKLRPRTAKEQKERDGRASEVRSRVERLLKSEVEGEPARKLKKYLLERGEELWVWIGTGGRADSNPAEQGIRFHISMKRKVSGGSRTLGVAQRTAALASLQATARMRSVPFAEIGRRLFRGDPSPLSPGAGPQGPRGPEPG